MEVTQEVEAPWEMRAMNPVLWKSACFEPFPSHWPGCDSVRMELQCLPQAIEIGSGCLWQEALSKQIRVLLTLGNIA